MTQANCSLLSPLHPQELPGNTQQSCSQRGIPSSALPRHRSRELPAFQAALERYVEIGVDFAVEGTSARRDTLLGCPG